MPILGKEEMAALRCLLLLLFISVTYSQIITGPSSTAVERGDRVTLTCSVDGGTGPYTFLWQEISGLFFTIFNGNDKTSDERYGNFEVSNRNTSSNITISQIAIDDEGRYSCSAGLLTGPAAKIDVEVKGALTTTFPSIVVADQSYDVQCMVTGSRPQVSINWYIDGVQQGKGVPTTAQTPSNSNLSDTSIAFTFTPSKVVPPGTVELKCDVKGYRADTIPAPEEVNTYSVKYPPESVTVMSTMVGNGTRSRVSCEIESSQDGNPASSNFLIYVNGNLIHESASGINYTEINTPKTGSSIKCVAGNKFGNVTAEYTSPSIRTAVIVAVIVLVVIVGPLVCVIFALLYRKGYCGNCVSFRYDMVSKSPGGEGAEPKEDYPDSGKDDRGQTRPTPAPRKGSLDGAEYAMVSKSPGGGGADRGQPKPEEGGMHFATLDLSHEAGHTDAHIPQNQNDVVDYSSIVF